MEVTLTIGSFCSQYWAALRAKYHSEIAYKPYRIDRYRGPDLKISILRPETIIHEHTKGCLHSAKPSMIVKGTVDVSKSLYLKRCDGTYKNIEGEKLESKLTEEESKENGEEDAKWASEEGLIEREKRMELASGKVRWNEVS